MKKQDVEQKKSKIYLMLKDGRRATNIPELESAVSFITTAEAISFAVVNYMGRKVNAVPMKYEGFKIIQDAIYKEYKRFFQNFIPIVWNNYEIFLTLDIRFTNCKCPNCGKLMEKVSKKKVEYMLCSCGTEADASDCEKFDEKQAMKG